MNSILFIFFLHWPASPRVPPISVTPQFENYRHAPPCLSFHVGAQGTFFFNLHAYSANTFPTKSSLQQFQ